MSDQPQGEDCPGCGQPAMNFGVLQAVMAQRFCGNNQCHVFTWDPDRSLTELVDDFAVIDIPVGFPFADSPIDSAFMEER